MSGGGLLEQYRNGGTQRFVPRLQLARRSLITIAKVPQLVACMIAMAGGA